MSGNGPSVRAVFLDRDGTLIRERDYLSDPDGVELLPGVPEAMTALRETGLRLVVVTNQSGIERGYYSVEAYRAVEARVDEMLAQAGASVDGTYFCPAVDDNADCRKPNTGMHRQAADELGIELVGSYFVGDKISDLLPAERLDGVGILVRTGYGREHEARLPEWARVEDDLLAVSRFVHEREGRR